MKFNYSKVTSFAQPCNITEVKKLILAGIELGSWFLRVRVVETNYCRKPSYLDGGYNVEVVQVRPGYVAVLYRVTTLVGDLVGLTLKFLSHCLPDSACAVVEIWQNWQSSWTNW